MPKIKAATVAEHRAMVREKLIEATEQIVRTKGPDALTAGAVASMAGIARNSIYRYVDSVEDLKMLVLDRQIPEWGREIFGVGADMPPQERLIAFALASLDHSVRASHGWLMGLMRSGEQSTHHAATKGNVDHVHGKVDEFLLAQWEALHVENPREWMGMSRALIFEAFHQVETGVDISHVRSVLEAALRACVAASLKN